MKKISYFLMALLFSISVVSCNTAQKEEVVEEELEVVVEETAEVEAEETVEVEAEIQ